MTHLTLAVFLLTVAPAAPQHTHASHAAMDARGAKAMGFDQALASHHFVVTDDGGRIEIDARDPADADTRGRIAAHLEHISVQFKAGDFSIPHETHAGLPSGAAEMIALKADIDYRYVASPAGGRVQIVARTPAAISAVHAFLRYQIDEHTTGDSLTVRR